MAIPKVIYQTFKSKKLPLITKLFIWRFKKLNPEYKYEFYDDIRIEEFLKKEFPINVFNAYSLLKIGAAKADFFRYAILYKNGGIYVDIDSYINCKLNKFIKEDDVAIITKEGDFKFYVQWALIFEAGHPFLKKTIELMIDNIEKRFSPYNSHYATGPTVFSNAINECILINPQIKYRLLGIDYNGFIKFKYPLSKFFLYKKGEHWKKAIQKGIYYN